MTDENNDVILEAKDKANIFNRQFSKAFIQDNHLKPDLSRKYECTIPMECPEITPYMVMQSISQLKSSVSITPDNIPALFLKKTKTVITKPLSNLFNMTLRRMYISHNTILNLAAF